MDEQTLLEGILQLAPWALGAAAVAGLVASLLVPVVRAVALSVRAVDYPGGRRDHARAIPRLGGVAVIVGVFLGVGPMVLVQWPRHGVDVARSHLAAWAFGLMLVFLIGLLEDVVRLSSVKRFLVEVAAALIVVAAGWSFTQFSLPFIGPVELGWLGPVITVVWIVGVTNAVNLIDGLDGLAAGVIAIIAGSLAVLEAVRGNVFSTILLAGVAGACLGFLRHNRAPATIFMGDAGSLTLGFVLGTMTVHGSLKSSAAVAILVPILALGVPVIDTLLVMVVRFLERPRGGWQGRLTAMFRADRSHIHHLLLHVGRHRGRVVKWLYMMVLLTCGAALTVALTKSGTLGLVLVVMEIAIIAGMRWMGLARQAREIGFERRRELLHEIDEPDETTSLRVS